MIKTFKGLVISANDYREKDVILTVLLEDDRIKSLITKGAKTLSSKKRMVAMPYTLCEFVFDDNEVKKFAFLNSSHLIASYFSANDIAQNAALSLIGELTWRIEERDILSFDLVKRCFEMCKEDTFLAVTFYLAQLLKALGLSPMVDHCVFCGETKVVAFSNQEGGFLCKDHLDKGNVVSLERLKKLRLINKCPLDSIDLLKDYHFDYHDFILEAEFFFYHTDLKLKAYEFFKTIF